MTIRQHLTPSDLVLFLNITRQLTLDKASFQTTLPTEDICTFKDCASRLHCRLFISHESRVVCLDDRSELLVFDHPFAP